MALPKKTKKAQANDNAIGEEIAQMVRLLCCRVLLLFSDLDFLAFFSRPEPSPFLATVRQPCYSDTEHRSLEPAEGLLAVDEFPGILRTQLQSARSSVDRAADF